MARQPDREPFAEAVEWLAEQITPHGPPAEMTPLPVDTIEETAQAFSDELQEPLIKKPLIDLLHDYQNNPTVEGVGLVVVAGRTLSIRALTDFTQRRDEQWQRHEAAIGDRYDVFAQTMYDAVDADPTPKPLHISWRLSFYNTAGRPGSTLVPKITQDMSREVEASLCAFITFEKPVTLPNQ